MLNHSYNAHVSIYSNYLAALLVNFNWIIFILSQDLSHDLMFQWANQCSSNSSEWHISKIVNCIFVVLVSVAAMTPWWYHSPLSQSSVSHTHLQPQLCNKLSPWQIQLIKNSPHWQNIPRQKNLHSYTGLCFVEYLNFESFNLSYVRYTVFKLKC